MKIQRRMKEGLVSLVCDSSGKVAFWKVGLILNQVAKWPHGVCYALALHAPFVDCLQFNVAEEDVLNQQPNHYDHEQSGEDIRRI